MYTLNMASGTRSSRKDFCLESLLLEINEKLSGLNSKTDTLLETIKKMEGSSEDGKERLNMMSIDLNNFIKAANSFSECSVVGLAVNDNKNRTMIDSVSQAMNENTLLNEAYRQRKRIINTWKINLNKRKQLFWNYYKQKQLSCIYETWIGRESPILPQKYLIREIEGELLEETTIRFELAVQTFTAEIRLAELKKKRFEDKYREIDSLMNDEIEKLCSNEIADTLKEIWAKEVSSEEAKSAKIWEPKKAFLIRYEENYGRQLFANSENDANGHTSRRHAVPVKTRNTKRNNFNQQARPSVRENANSDNGRNIKQRSDMSWRSGRNQRSEMLYSDVVRVSETSLGKNKKEPTESQSMTVKTRVNPNNQPQLNKKSQRVIHFLGRGHPNPRRKKDPDQTLVKTLE